MIWIIFRFLEMSVLILPYLPQLMCFVVFNSAIKGTGVMKKAGVSPHPRHNEVLTILETLMKIFSAMLYGK